jgi:hypothetical protein
MKNTRIISAFPGVGKTWLYQHQEQLGITVLDSDSSQFSWIEEGVRHPDFPNNYIQHIKDNLGKVDVICVSSHDVVRQALKENGLNYTIVYPDWSEKERYINRFIDRGNDVKFIKFISDNWFEFIRDIKRDDFPEHWELPWGDFYLDYFFLKVIDNEWNDPCAGCICLGCNRLGCCPCYSCDDNDKMKAECERYKSE